jgi:DNA-binding GntR family transcriptional regulator
MSSVAGWALVRSVRDQIVDYLRAEILTGRLAEGERLLEAKLAEQFGVSRGPIREALAQLTFEGLLVSKANCGVTVSASASMAIREFITPIRRTIETYALKLCFDDLTEKDLRTWGEILHHMEHACKQEDVHAIAKHDIAFHRYILVRSGESDLLTIWQTILGRLRNYFWQGVPERQNNLMSIHADHQKLMKAFRSGDKETAVRALEKHISFPY